jgi:hypothetical protein
LEYYINPANRGYLADPGRVAEERLLLAQKYGYEPPPDYSAQAEAWMAESKAGGHHRIRLSEFHIKISPSEYT